MTMAAASFARPMMLAGVAGLSLGVCALVVASPVLENGGSGPSRAEGMPLSYPPIRSAILGRDVEKVRRLVAAGADIEQLLFNDESPALMAAKVDCWDIVLFLLEQGADPAAPDVFGDTIAPIARTSRLHPDAPEYRDLEAVRAILHERGLY